MRQPTCVFVETVQIAEIADSALSALPGQGTGSFRVSRSSPVPPPHVPPERSVPCRFAWPLPGGRAVILFKANEKSNDATQAKRKRRPEPPATSHVHAPPPGHVHARTSISLGGLSFTLRLAGSGARREQARAPRPATRRARPRAVCGATGPHPRRAPRPRACRDRTGERASKRAGGVAVR